MSLNVLFSEKGFNHLCPLGIECFEACVDNKCSCPTTHYRVYDPEGCEESKCVIIYV